MPLQVLREPAGQERDSDQGARGAATWRALAEIAQDPRAIGVHVNVIPSAKRRRDQDPIHAVAHKLGDGALLVEQIALQHHHVVIENLNSPKERPHAPGAGKIRIAHASDRRATERGNSALDLRGAVAAHNNGVADARVRERDDRPLDQRLPADAKQALWHPGKG